MKKEFFIENFVGDVIEVTTSYLVIASTSFEVIEDAVSEFKNRIIIESSDDFEVLVFKQCHFCDYIENVKTANSIYLVGNDCNLIHINTERNKKCNG